MRFNPAFGLALAAALGGCSPQSFPALDDPPPALAEDRDPTFSPSGDSIAFAHWSSVWQDSIEPTGLYVVGATGGTPRLVIRGDIMCPDWSPDGRWIAFVLANGSPLFVVSPTGDSLRKVTSFSGAFPSWSPDGRELLFATDHTDPTGGRVLWIVPFDGSPPRDISRHGTGEWLDGDWSPDGQYIVHERFLTGVRGAEIFIMQRDGTGGRRLTYDSFSDGGAVWSPRDPMIAWTQSDAVRIQIMRTDGTNLRALADGSQPAWSPDGRTIAFARIIRRGPHWVRLLFAVGVDGAGLRQITFR